jgi:hypothetical protein
MNEERRKVLELLAAGKISPADAERILEKLSARETSPPRGHDDTFHGAVDDVHAAIEDVGKVAVGLGARVWGWQWPRRGKPNYLRIQVQDHEGDDVNVRLPMELIRTGLRVSAIMPDRVNEKLREQGVDLHSLGELDEEELIAQLRDLNVDVSTAEGERVRVYCE